MQPLYIQPIANKARGSLMLSSTILLPVSVAMATMHK